MVNLNSEVILLLLCQVHDEDEIQEIREDDESMKPVVNSKVVKLPHIFINFYFSVKLHMLSSCGCSHYFRRIIAPLKYCILKET